MSKRDFYRLLGAHYKTQQAAAQAIKEMRKHGLVRDEIRLTATASAKLNSVKKELS